MFGSLLVLERGRRPGVIGSIVVLLIGCVLYLALRIGFTSGYQHQIDPVHVAGQFTSLNFPAHFFIQMILAQGMLVLLLILIMTKRPGYAAYLLISAAAMAVVALATDVTDVGLLLGESLPFYAAIFMLLWNGALAPVKELSRAQSGNARRVGSPKSAG